MNPPRAPRAASTSIGGTKRPRAQRAQQPRRLAISRRAFCAACRAAVPRVAGLALLAAERQLLAVADRGKPIGGDAERDEVVLHRLRAARAERKVVLDRAALVAVALDLGARARVVLQPLGVRGED